MSTSPSEPARGPYDAPKVVPPAPPLFRPAAVALVVAVFPWLLVGALTFFKPFNGANGDVADIAFGALIVSMLASPFVAWFLAHRAVKKLRDMHVDERPPGMKVALVARGVAVGTIVAGFLYTCFGMTVMRGRQLRRRGKARLASLVAGRGWNGATTTLRIDAPHDVAAAWRHNALTEHASVASFSHVALDLIALGAPASLVRACHEAALDEVAHAQLCFDIATAIDGETRTPTPFADASTRPGGDVTLTRVAVESLIEGALLEGAAAHVAAHLARTSCVPNVRRVLATIAADEKRHAEHGWRVLEWCVAQDARLVDVLQRALDNAPLDVDAGPLADGSGEAFGIASHATLRASYARALDETHARLAALTETRSTLRAA
jgi:hypothetical protein